MKNKKITISSLVMKNDGLGGYLEDYTDLQFYGKCTYSKDRMVITRAHDLNTQKLVGMRIVYLNTRYNNVSDLRKIKRGDRMIENGVEYRVNVVEAYHNIFVITFLEEFAYNNENRI